MSVVEFASQSARDPDSTWANTARLLNCYIEPIGEAAVIKSVPGTQPFATLSGVNMRAMATISGTIYAVHGGNLLSVDSAGEPTTLDAIPDSDEVSISGNNGNVAVTSNDDYYLWNGTTISQPTTGAFSLVGSVTFYNQLTVITEKDGRRVQWSDPADPATFNGLNFATAEGRDDNVIRALPVGGALWVFKQGSIEPWANAGSDLRAIPGATIDVGLKAFNLLTSIPRGAFFIGSDNKAYLAAGGGLLPPISTPAVETSISTQTPSKVMYYQDEGHEFCVITFAARPAWIYDISTAQWHERSSDTTTGVWRSQAATSAYGGYYIANNAGDLSLLGRFNQDFDGPLIRKAVSKTFENAGSPFVVDLFELKARRGHTELAGEAPTVSLRTSRDYGQTWGEPKPRPLGLLGQFDKRITYRNLGQFQQFTAEVSWSDPVEVTIGTAANLDVS